MEDKIFIEEEIATENEPYIEVKKPVKYVAFNKETGRVSYAGDKKPVAYSEGIDILEVETLPDKYDFLTVENGEVVANFITLTDEQVEAKRQAEYEAKVDRLVREKYSLSNELAILRQRDTKPEEFSEYNTYVELCKAIAKAEEETV